MLSDEEKKIILDFFKKGYTLEEFVNIYPVGFEKLKDYPRKIITDAIKEKNAEDIDYAFSLANIIHSNIELNVQEICSLLLMSGHSHHEDLANWLRDEAPKDVMAIDALYQASFLQLDYLKEDDFFELARKCLHALRAIGTPESIEKIKAIFKEAKNETIRSYALRQLEKLEITP